MKKILFIFYIFSLFHAFGQIAVNADGSDPDPSAMLDISATDKGILIPRMTSDQRTAINPAAEGLMVYDTDTQSFWYHDGTQWVETSNAKNAWSTLGNEGTDPSINFLGTIDSVPLIIRTYNTEKARMTEGGYIGLGTQTPRFNLHGYTDAGRMVLSFETSDAASFAGIQARSDIGTTAIYSHASDRTIPRRWGRPIGGYYEVIGNTWGAPQLPEGMIVGPNPAIPLYLGTNDTLRLMITEFGKVGINTLAPGARLHVYETFTQNQTSRGIYNHIKVNPDTEVTSNYLGNYTFMEFDPNNSQNFSIPIEGSRTDLKISGNGNIDIARGGVNYVNLIQARNASQIMGSYDWAALRDSAQAISAIGSNGIVSIYNQANVSGHAYGGYFRVNDYSADSTAENVYATGIIAISNILGKRNYTFATGGNFQVYKYGLNDLKQGRGSVSSFINQSTGGDVRYGIGAYNQVKNQSDSTITFARGTTSYINNSAAGTIYDAIGTLSSMDNSGTGTITNFQGFYARGANGKDGNAAVINKAYMLRSYFINNHPASLTTFYSNYHSFVNESSEPINRAQGLYTQIINDTVAGGINYLHLLEGFFRNESDSAISQFTGVYSQLVNTGAGEINTAYGVRTKMSNTGTGDINKYYGVFVDGTTRTDSSWYGIYVGKNLKSYFGHRIGIKNYHPQRELAIGGAILMSAANNVDSISDIWFRAQGAVAAESNLALMIDAANTGGNFFFDIRRGAETYADSQTLVRVKNDGKVGIGTTAPARKLHVAGTEAILRLEPQSVEPANPQNGDIYMDDGTNTSDGQPKLRVYANGWHELW